LISATISWRVSWKPLEGLCSGSFWISFSEKRIFRAVPRPSVCTGPHGERRRACQRRRRRRRRTECPRLSPVGEAHLYFPPQATFTAADTIHDPGDVFEMEAKILLKDEREERRERKEREKREEKEKRERKEEQIRQDAMLALSLYILKTIFFSFSLFNYKEKFFLSLSLILKMSSLSPPPSLSSFLPPPLLISPSLPLPPSLPLLLPHLPLSPSISPSPPPLLISPSLSPRPTLPSSSEVHL